MIARAAGLAAVAAAVLTGAGCSSSSSSAPVFHPEGKASTSAAPSATAAAGSATSGGYVMPPFGSNVHVQMTSWLPSNHAQAAAVNADKSYELAFWYAEYKGGQDNSWTQYVAQNDLLTVRNFMNQPDIAKESWRGSAKIFDMRVVPDPTVKRLLDVSGCANLGKTRNTDIKTGEDLPPQPASQLYYRFTDQLEKGPGGKWVVAASLPTVNYPRAKECKS